MKTKLVIFGLTGDLGRRKLLPALDSLLEKNEISPDELEVIGVSRRQIQPFEILESSLGLSRAENSKLSQILSFFEMNLADETEYKNLKKYLQDENEESQILLYLSVPPASAAQISTLAGKAGLNGENVKILFEKPFGIDLKSAQEFISRTAEFFSEKQIFRIDHYLAKEMAQNLLILRHKNALFSQIWNGKSISKVQIVASEQIGIEGRGTFYEQSGALRDFIQSHLIQILALFLADFPKSWNDLPEARFKALEQIEKLQNPEENAIRGQYQTYREEVENPKSCVETFAKIRLFSKDKNWKNVPFELISGKNLSEKRSEIHIHLRKTEENQANLKKVFSRFPRLEERKNQDAATLSGGEQQMLAMGRALMSTPKLLLLDEPSMGLAPIFIQEIFDIIQDIQKQGTTVLLIEQNANKALAISDRGYVLETGKIVLSGTGKELASSEEVRKAYLGG